ncbi:hypothetical protein [Haladaptatus sp. DFWS20]
MDSLEALYTDRIATFADYFNEYAGCLVAAPLLEDAAALDEEYQRIANL